MKQYPYDVALSFAGEDRPYVDRVAVKLKEFRVDFFYDQYDQVGLWGKDLYVHLDDIYQKRAKYCVMFLSRSYAQKLWTNHERESAQARAFTQHEEYILPARFDDTEIPGIRPTTGYIDLRNTMPENFAELVRQKVNGDAPTYATSQPSEIQMPNLPNVGFNEESECKLFFKRVCELMDRNSGQLSNVGVKNRKIGISNECYQYRFEYNGRLAYFLEFGVFFQNGHFSIHFLDGWNEPRSSCATSYTGEAQFKSAGSQGGMVI
jgi:hypothetical protein